MILVTGGTGFVGRAVVQRLVSVDKSQRVVVAVRRPGLPWFEGVVPRQGGELSADSSWLDALEGVSAVVHCAARVHVMRDTVSDPLTEFRSVNVEGTLNLARQAAAAGVKRFLFVSSIKVNGELTQPGQFFSAEDKPAPLDAYGISKMEAERGLLEVASKTGMEVVVIRPPLVYGHGAKGNFAAMLRFLRVGVPLPLGAINNRRSLVALDNLVDLIATCISHRAAAGNTFLVSDGEDVSTTDLLRRLGEAMGRPARLVPVPAVWLEYAARLLGKREVAKRICGSLQVDIGKTRRVLGWSPPLSLDEGLRIAAGNRVNT
jgi:nucleoside-diphosphate-sugar epimerase